MSSRIDVIATLRAAGCVFAEEEADLLLAEGGTPAELEAMVERRVSGVPLEHVLGWAEFAGMRIAVDPGVFVPRARTEFLVERAADLSRPGAVVLDLCCGSGAIGVALAASLGRIELYAADIDARAVSCARRNIAPLAGHVYQGDLYEPLPESLKGRVDILVANVPYVPTEEIEMMPREARVHEPRVALDGGKDGLDPLRKVAAGAPQWLATGGHLLVETSQLQAPAALMILTGSGLTPRVARSSDWDATVVIGARPGSALGP